MGNSNWILWLSTCRQMSKSKKVLYLDLINSLIITRKDVSEGEIFERLVYASLSYNHEIIREFLEKDKKSLNYWHDSLWIDFRVIHII